MKEKPNPKEFNEDTYRGNKTESLKDQSESNENLKEDVKVLQRNESKVNFPQILSDSSLKSPAKSSNKANKSSPSSLSSSYKILPPISNFEKVRIRDYDKY